MFGIYYPGQSYPAEGPAATIEFIPLNICNADSYSLMPELLADLVMPALNSATLMPDLDSERYCAPVVTLPPLGNVRFNVPPDHYSVLYYEVRVRVVGDPTVIASQNIGHPTPADDGTITYDLTPLFVTLPLGIYNVTVAAINEDGETDSGYSNDFSLPL